MKTKELTKKKELLEEEAQKDEALAKLEKKEPEINAGDKSDNADAANAKTQEESENKSEEKSTADKDKLSYEERKAEFEKLIKGEYKDVFSDRIKENISRRFKETDALKKQLAQTEEVVDMLKSRYGLEEADIEAVKEAVDADDSYLKEEAQKRGIKVEDLRYIKNLEQENARLKKDTYEAIKKAQMKEKVEALYKQSNETKEEYPDFDIQKESENPKFASLIKGGVDVKTAYEVIHHDDIISKIVDKTAKETQKKTAESIRSVQSRPQENGTGDNSSALIVKDVSKLTKKERAEIAKRVARGENITF